MILVTETKNDRTTILHRDSTRCLTLLGRCQKATLWLGQYYFGTFGLDDVLELRDWQGGRPDALGNRGELLMTITVGLDSRK